MMESERQGEEPMKKTTQLRNLITSPSLEFIMEAHHALSAKIVEEAGFKGIWASGLSISAAMGVRDNNEASWTQVLEVLEFMSDATSIPILLDGDTGYGNFNNARRLVKKLEQRKIAGVCIEDKLFPKTNSFIRGEAQPLADIDEFCGKIKAMKDSQTDDDFVVVSRVEALIAGWGLNEALRRAEAYRQAGTDAILIHSKRSDFTEIAAFMKEWAGRLPVVIVPTKYYTVPTERFRELGISLCIWANHNLRASIKAIQQTSAQIFYEQTLANIEKQLTPLEEVFRLQGAEELAKAEQLYLYSAQKRRNAIILVAQSGEQPLLPEQINQLRSTGISDIVTVGSSRADEKYCNYKAVGQEVQSLYLAREQIRNKTLISKAEIIYKPHVIQELMDDASELIIAVDPDLREQADEGVFVITNEPYSKKHYSQTVDLVHMTTNRKDGKITGEFFGLWKASGNGANVLKHALETLARRNDFAKLTIIDLINYVQTIHPIKVKYVKGSWLDLQTHKMLKKAGEKT
jgi:phosphoenolpyruvate phosphomutase